MEPTPYSRLIHTLGNFSTSFGTHRKERGSKMTNDRIPDDELRKSLGESLNIYQATVAICSIFLGFVFAGLIQLLGGSGPLTANGQWVVRVLVLALLFILGGLIGFHFTANQTVRYWRVFFPHSTARTVATVMFQLGIIAMLAAIALLLFGKGERASGLLVTLVALGMFRIVFMVGAIHRGAPYVRAVDKLRESKPPPEPAPSDKTGP